MGNSRSLLLGLVVWACVGLVVGMSGLLERLPRPALQLIIVGVTLVLLLIAFVPSRFGRIGAGLAALPLRALLAVHLTRFVGFYFLYLHGHGRLPEDFAVRGGWGDIIAASLAALLILLNPDVQASGGRLRPLLVLWNLFGLADILMVIFYAARNGLRDPASMVELTRVPLCLLPTMVVPLILATHVLIFVRLARSAGRG